MKTLIPLLASCVVCLQDNKEPAGLSAPVHYDGLMLVFSTDKEICAVVFGEEIAQGDPKEGRTEGVKYRFRLYSKENKKESKGEGAVFEKYRRLPNANPKVIELLDLGSEKLLRAGTFQVRWSYCCPGKGWVSYLPETMRIYIANAEDFQTLKLERFR